MTGVFVFGTLRHPPLLTLVAGEVVPADTAVLPGEAVMTAAGEDWPVLTPGVPEGRVEGLLLSPSPKALARLDFYEACFGYSRVPVTVHTASGPQEVSVWRPEAQGDLPAVAGPWSLDAWVEAAAPLSLRAAREMLRRRAYQSPRDVGQRFGIIRARAQAELLTADWQRPGRFSSPKGRSDVQVIESRTPYADYYSVETIVARHRRFDGGMSDPVERSVFRVGDAVTVLPYDPLRDCVVFVEQLRFAPLVQGDARPWLFEPVAGMIDAGETPEAAGRREAVEEAGLTLQAMHFVARYYPSPGGVAQVLHSYVATADLPPDAATIAGHAGEGEDIRSHVISFADLEVMLAEGDLTDAASIISVMWLRQHREELRKAARAATHSG